MRLTLKGEPCPPRLLSIIVIAAVMSGCGASAEQIETANRRIMVLAFCLDEVAEGIGTGTFEPKSSSASTSSAGMTARGSENSRLPICASPSWTY